MHFKISPLAEITSAIPVLANWHHQEWKHLNDPAYDLSARINDYEKIIDADSFPAMFVAHNEDTALGSVRLIDDDMDTHPELTPWLASLYVHPDYRHKGIGSALIQTIEDTASKLNFKTIYLFTEDKQTIYQKQDWQIYANEIYYDQAVTIMCKTL